MSNDPSPRENDPPNTLVLDDPESTTTVDPTRRRFLKYLGAGVVIASLPELPGCAVQSAPPSAGSPLAGVDVEALVNGATYVDVLRTDDLLSFQLGLVNLVIESTARMTQPPGLTLNGSLWLQRDNPNLPAFLIVNFQPQHIQETAFGEQADPKPNGPAAPASNAPGGRTPVDARIAQGSRVVFVVPSNVTAIPYELGPLLAALASYGLNVAANALPAPSDVRRVGIPVGFGNGALVKSAATHANQATRKGSPLRDAIALSRARRATRAFAAANPEASLRDDVEPALVRGLGVPVPEALVPNPPPGPINPGPPIVISPPPAPTIPVQPSELETAIELPYRLVISPNAYAHFAHEASDPPNLLGSARVELWHTSLTTPATWQQTIRALWTRDPTFTAGDSSDSYYSGEAGQEPFQTSLYDDDRGDIVQLTTNYTLKDSAGKSRTAPVDANRLMLSTLGGWLDAHGKWNDPPGWNPKNPAASIANPGLVAWDHTADMARDSYVRVVRFGYLYPWGHKCVKVRVTQRKFDPSNPSIAYLWQHEYFIVKEPLRTYDTLPAQYANGVPFTSVRFKTLVTPSVDLPNDPSHPSTLNNAEFPNSMFVQIGGQPFPFELEAFDQAGNKHAFNAACIWLPNDDALQVGQFPSRMDDLNALWTKMADQRWVSDLKSQRVAYGIENKPDDTCYTTAGLGAVATVPIINGLYGVANEAPWVPQLGKAALAVDTIRGITGDATPQPFTYNATYLAHGFDGNLNVGEVMLDFTSKYDAAATQPKLDVHKMTHKSGGFVAPSLAASGLSRSHGIISGNPDRFAAGGDVSKNPNLSGKSGFDPSDFFNLLDSAKLFGCINISDILEAFGGDFFKQAPKFVTQALEPIEEALDLASKVVDLASEITTDLDDVTSALAAITAGPPYPTSPVDLTGLITLLQSKAGALAIPGGVQGWATQVNQLAGPSGAVQQAVDAANAMGTAVSNAITAIGSGGDVSTQAGAVETAFTNALGALSTLSNLLSPGLPTTLSLPIDGGTRTQVIQALGAVTGWMKTNGGAALITVLKAFLMAEDAIENLHIKLDWSPKLAPWPAAAPLFLPKDLNGFHVGVEIRGKESGGQPAGADVYASLSNFQLALLGDNPVITLDFDKLAFTAGSSSDPDVDCVFNGMHFHGALGFVEVLRQFIPMDGFSDPPALDVTTSGITASFALPLPSISVGMFSLENLSFNAGFQIPFIGKSLAVDFSFCTRESPFVLTVSMLGGGGFVGLTITPAGVQKLEISLEATACLSIDFGIASGSISISVGIYLCIEQNDCKLTGFVKFDGHVSVLEIVSASISLDLELSFESATGKVIGEADLEISVSLLCFSISVSCKVQRKFKGSNADPTFRQIMAPFCASNPQLVLPDPACTSGFEVPWNDYVDAFVPLQGS